MRVGHFDFDEQEEGDMFRVGHLGEVVVAEDVGGVSSLVDDVLGVGAHYSLCRFVAALGPIRRASSLPPCHDRIVELVSVDNATSSAELVNDERRKKGR